MRILQSLFVAAASLFVLSVVPARAATPGERHVPAEPLKLRANDGVVIYGAYYQATHPKALILLFHQADSSKNEYAQIAPRLVAAGYSALAIDQRSGGGLFGKNETALRLGRPATNLDAKPDLEAALAWGSGKGLRLSCGAAAIPRRWFSPLPPSTPDPSKPSWPSRLESISISQ